jgi:hypothetical protein
MNRNAQSELHIAKVEDAELAVIDRILDSEDALLPSSGFSAAVMECVREEAAAPAPIPFPWKRVLPGLVAIMAALGWCVYELGRSLISAAKNLPAVELPVFGGNLQVYATVGWIALALLAPLLSWLFARRMMGGARLL